MTLRALQVFLKVSETLNMQAAARALYISAPSVSECIAELEREYETRLFERMNRKLYLTAAGERMRDYALRMTSMYDEMRRQLMHTSAPLRLGVTMTIASSVLLPILRRIGEPKPYVTVCNTREVERLLLLNELDIGYVEGAIQHPKLIATPVDTDRLVLACPRAHPFASRATLLLAELQGAALLLRERGSGTRERLTRALERGHIEPHVLWECGSVDALVRAVREGIGATVISQRLVPADLAAVPIADFDGERAFSLVVHADKFETDAMKRFAQACREEGAHGGEGSKPTN